MNAIRGIEKYLNGCGVGCSGVHPYDLSADYPIGLAARFDSVRMTLSGTVYVVIEPKSEMPPDEVIGACRQIAATRPVLLALEFADREYSECLRKAKVDYIVPGRQLYLPPHAVLTPPEAYERYEKLFLRDFLSPWAQVVFLRILLFHRGEEPVAYSALQDELKINGVYLTRAGQELEYHRLAELRKAGRNRLIALPSDRRLLWKAAEKCLRSPVLKRLRYAGKTDAALTAGYPALVAASDLVGDGEPVCAMTVNEVRKLKEKKIQKYRGAQIEVWRYDPRLLSSGQCVDPLSLYLSMKDSPDARIQIALAELLEKTL